MSSRRDPHSDANQRPTVGYFGLIFTAAIVVLVGVWIYFLLGDSWVDNFGKAVITVVVIAVMIFAWRLHRWRQRKALDLLQRWAEKDEAPPARPRRD